MRHVLIHLSSIVLLIALSELFVRRFRFPNNLILGFWGAIGGTSVASSAGYGDGLRWEWFAYFVLGYIGFTLLGVLYSWLRGWPIELGRK